MRSVAALSAGEVVSLEQPTSAAAATTRAILRMEPPTGGRRRYTEVWAPVQSNLGRTIRVGVNTDLPRLADIGYWLPVTGNAPESKSCRNSAGYGKNLQYQTFWGWKC